MQLLSVLMPRERQFFTLFNNYASLVVQGAATLVEMLSSYSNSGKREEYVAKIHSIEHAADEVTHQTVQLMHNTFVTPEVQHLASIMQICCARVHDAVTQLSSMDNGPAILKICQEIDSLESDVDRFMRSAISRLFREEQDTRQLIKLTTGSSAATSSSRNQPFSGP